MAAETAMIHVRVDQELKTKATLTLNKMGLSMSDAVRLLLKRIEADQALPFEVKVPNAETIAAMRAAERGEVTSFATIEELMAHLHADD
jgi:DNA-damage-inducible protein J